MTTLALQKSKENEDFFYQEEQFYKTAHLRNIDGSFIKPKRPFKEKLTSWWGGVKDKTKGLLQSPQLQNASKIGVLAVVMLAQSCTPDKNNIPSVSVKEPPQLCPAKFKDMPEVMMDCNKMRRWLGMTQTK